MRKILTTYLVVVVLFTLGFFGVGAIASAQELQDPMRPPAFALQKFREAKLAGKTTLAAPRPGRPPAKPLQLTSILFSNERKIAIIDDQMLSLGDSIRGAKLIGLTRESARLLRKGKVINLRLGNDTTAVMKKAVESDR